jgi:hypothetical protein
MKNKGKRYTQADLDVIEEKLINNIDLDSFSDETTKSGAKANGIIMDDAIGKYDSENKNDLINKVAKELKRDPRGLRWKTENFLKKKGYVLNPGYNKEYK